MIKTAEKRGGEALMNLIRTSSDLPWCKPEQISSAVQAAKEKGTGAALDYVAMLPSGALDKAGMGLDTLVSNETSAEVRQWLENHPAPPANTKFTSRLTLGLEALER